MSQARERFFLDLPNPLARYTHQAPDLFERHRFLILQAEVQLQYSGFAILEGLENLTDRLGEGVFKRFIVGSSRLFRLPGGVSALGVRCYPWLARNQIDQSIRQSK